MRLALASSLLLIGCTAALGIDGNYTLVTKGPQETPAGAGGAPETHDAGTGSAMARDAGVEAGVTPVIPVPDADATAGCYGTYRGTMGGTHTGAFTFVPLPIGLAGATFSFEVGRDNQLQHGTITATLTLLSGGAPAGMLTGTLVGTFDCATQTLDGQLSGKMAPLDVAQLVNIDGTFTGQLTDGATMLWAEHESGFPLPIVNLTQSPPKGTGYGIWTLTTQP